MRQVLAFLMCALLFACESGTSNGVSRNDQPDSNPPTCGGKVGLNTENVSILCANPTVMKFKSSNGQEVVSWSDVTSVEIALAATLGGSDEPLQRVFSGEDALRVVSQLSLGFPKEDGLPASISTGTIVIHYKHHTDSSDHQRKLTIQNSQLIEDETFPEVTYRPSKVLDRKWLEEQSSN